MLILCGFAVHMLCGRGERGSGVWMPAAVKIARTTHTAEDLHALARSGKGAAQNARLSMAALVPDGVGRAEAARSAFRSEFAVRVRGRVRGMLGLSALSRPVAVRFQDEVRVGGRA